MNRSIISIHQILSFIVAAGLLIPAGVIAETVDFSLGEFSFQVETAPFQMTVSDTRGNVLLETPASSESGAAILVNDEWLEISSVSLAEQSDSLYRFSGTLGETAEVEIAFEEKSGFVAVLVRSSGEGVGFQFLMSEEEHFSGMGQRFDGLNVRGKSIPTDIQPWTNPTPFYLSSKGYGLSLDTKTEWTFDFGAKDETVFGFEVKEGTIEIDLFSGPEPKKIIGAYTAKIGRMEMPPEWTFQPWKWRDWVFDELEVYEDVSMLETLDIPASVYMIDSPWSTHYSNYEINRKQFPDPQRLFEDLHNRGYKVILWHVPIINPSSSNFAEAAEKGYFVKTPEGEPYLINWWNPSGSPELGLEADPEGAEIDFTNPEAVAWWQSEVAKVLDYPVDGFKLDDGDLTPDDALFADGRCGYQVQDYCVLYEKAVHDLMKEKRGDDWYAFSRAFYPGTQLYMRGMWGADQAADFNNYDGLPTVVLGAQSLGLVGMPFYGSDGGGYKWSPTKEVFSRWIQFAAFSPIMQIGGKSHHEPWLYDDELESIYRRYSQLHSTMIDYILFAAKESCDTGVPMIRAMFLEFPDDPACYEYEYQYMFGPDLLVAPVVKESREKEVYLPKGKWLDWWTLEKIKGGRTVSTAAPLDQIPLFVRIEGEPKSRLLMPLLEKQSTALHQRLDFILEGNKKYLLTEPWKAAKEAQAALEANTPDFSGKVKNKTLREYENALLDFRSFIEMRFAAGDIPWHTHLTLNERLDAIEHTLAMLNEM